MLLVLTLADLLLRAQVVYFYVCLQGLAVAGYNENVATREWLRPFVYVCLAPFAILLVTVYLASFSVIFR